MMIWQTRLCVQLIVFADPRASFWIRGNLAVVGGCVVISRESLNLGEG